MTPRVFLIRSPETGRSLGAAAICAQARWFAPVRRSLIHPGTSSPYLLHAHSRDWSDGLTRTSRGSLAWALGLHHE